LQTKSITTSPLQLLYAYRPFVPETNMMASTDRTMKLQTLGQEANADNYLTFNNPDHVN